MIGGDTRVYGIIGDPVAHSLSPLLQNSAFACCGLDCCYVPFRVAAGDLPAAIGAVRLIGLGGVNVTIPHKERVAACLDEIDPAAALIGAVNTVVNRDGRLTGYNTDAAGFLASLQAEAGFDPRGKRVVLLGAGGAARAVSFALAQSGIGSLAVFDLIAGRAGRLATGLAASTGCRAETGGLEGSGLEGRGVEAGALAAALVDADLLVNATPVGMFPNQESDPPLDTGLLHEGLLVCDLVYNPPRTRLMAEAGARGCRVLSGAGMLVHQGALAFELWTGRRAPLEVMRQTLDNALTML